ncbi:MAG TPA: HAD family hydrolase [Pseudonocardiaceae bacterium]|nr:HAD family hydrolase [Pseudonocardiaceae bacterium]
MSVTTVVFDYFGTLTPSLRKAASGVDQPELAAILGVDRAAVETWWKSSYADRATGRTGDGLATMRLLSVSLGCTESEEALRAAQRIRLATYARMSRPRQDAVEVLTALRARGLRIGLLSDCSPELPELWPDLPLASLVDAPVFSSVVGECKPHPRMYATVCQRLGVSPAECLYVGDGGSNELTGATKVGMRAVLIADENWLGAHRFDTDDWQGETIHRLAEVPTLIPAT